MEIKSQILESQNFNKHGATMHEKSHSDSFSYHTENPLSVETFFWKSPQWKVYPAENSPWKISPAENFSRDISTYKIALQKKKVRQIIRISYGNFNKFTHVKSLQESSSPEIFLPTENPSRRKSSHPKNVCILPNNKYFT